MSRYRNTYAEPRDYVVVDPGDFTLRLRVVFKDFEEATKAAATLGATVTTPGFLEKRNVEEFRKLPGAGKTVQSGKISGRLVLGKRKAKNGG